MFSLKQMFGKQVKVTTEDCPIEGDRAWYEEIRGKRGFIYPQSETHVCVQTTKQIHKKLMELFGDKAKHKRHGDAEYELIIPVELTRSVFRYIKPRKYRQLSEAQKNVLRARLAAIRAAEVSGFEAKDR